MFSLPIWQLNPREATPPPRVGARGCPTAFCMWRQRGKPQVIWETESLQPTDHFRDKYPGEQGHKRKCVFEIQSTESYLELLIDVG